MAKKSVSAIVIVGGGFAGLRAALDLDKIYGDDLHTPIYLIDSSPFHIYTPGLYELTSAITPRVAAVPFTEILAGTNIQLVQEKVVRINTEEKFVQTETRKIEYGDVVVALGSQRKSHKKTKSDDISFTYKTLDDTLAIRSHIASCFLSAEQSASAQCHNHFIVAGGGPTGIEFVAGLQAYISRLTEQYKVNKHGVHVTLVEAAEHILARFDKRMGVLVKEYLKKQGITVREHVSMTPRGHDAMTLGKETLPLKTIFWTVGVSPHDIIATLKGCRHDDHGKVLVDASFQAIENEHIWVVGDNAAVEDAGLAWSAIAHGRHVAKAIRSKRAGQTPPAYVSRQFPMVLPLSSDYGVAWFPGDRIIQGKPVIWYKRFIDLRYYLSILPFWQACGVWLRKGEVVPESGEHVLSFGLEEKS